MSLADRTVKVTEGPSELTWPVKDPDDVLDYVIDWDARLNVDDTIVASAWTKPAEGEAIGFNYTIPEGSRTTRIWVRGGKPGRTYFFINHVTTAGERQMDQTVKLTVAQR